MSQHTISDEGRRLSDAVTVARLAGGEGRWIAARLSDGGTDGEVYDTRADAVRHQLHETLCAYVKIPPGVMPPAEATAFLALNRRIYDAGYRLSDPAGAAPPMPTTALGLAQALANAPAAHRARGLAAVQRRGKRR